MTPETRQKYARAIRGLSDEHTATQMLEAYEAELAAGGKTPLQRLETLTPGDYSERLREVMQDFPHEGLPTLTYAMLAQYRMIGFLAEAAREALACGETDTGAQIAREMYDAACIAANASTLHVALTALGKEPDLNE